MLPFPHPTFAKGTVFVGVMEAITTLGLTTNLALCLDVALSTCYSSGQTLTDLSAAGRNFIRGNTTGSSSDDPTFNGIANGKSSDEYFSVNGSQFLKDNSGLAGLNFHRDNATFTIMMVYRRPSGDTPLAGNTLSTDSYRGWRLTDESDAIRFFYGNSGGSINSLNDLGPTTAPNAWLIAFMSMNEASSTGHWRVNEATTAIASPWSSPAGSNTTTPCQLMGYPDGNTGANGLRMAAAAIWNGTALSSANTLAIFNAIKNRWGL